MNETRDLFARAYAKSGEGSLVVAHPLGAPVGNIAMCICSHQHVEADSASRQDLLPFRDFDVGLRGADNGNDKRCTCETRQFSLFGRFIHLRVTGEREFKERFAELCANVTPIDDKAPRRDFAMIGNADRHAQDRFELFLRWARACDLGNGRRVALLQVIAELQVVFHVESFRSIRDIEVGLENARTFVFKWLLAKQESTGHILMPGLSFVTRIAAAGLLLLTAADLGFAQSDAFGSFRQLDSTGKMPKLNAFSATPGESAGSIAKDVRFDARLTADSDVMQEGLAWRVFSPITGVDGKLPLVASSDGGSAAFQLAPGDYFVNVAFGRAGVTKKVTVPSEGDFQKQTLVLDAGGFILNAVAGADQTIPPAQLSFSVYAAEVRENGDRALVMSEVKPNTIVRLATGTYHVVSEYGDINAVVRADIQVEAGKLTQAVLQHKAAEVSLKLVSQPGGEAIADTAWSVLTAAGDVVNESVSALPSMVLAEGDYLAVARNKDKIYQREFKVTAGNNVDVEVLMRNANPSDATTAAVVPD